MAALGATPREHSTGFCGMCSTQSPPIAFHCMSGRLSLGDLTHVDNNATGSVIGGSTCPLPVICEPSSSLRQMLRKTFSSLIQFTSMIKPVHNALGEGFVNRTYESSD